MNLKSSVMSQLVSFLDRLRLMANMFSHHPHYFFHCTPALLQLACLDVWNKPRRIMLPLLLERGVNEALNYTGRHPNIQSRWCDVELKQSGPGRKGDVGSKWWNAFGLCQVTHIWDLSAAPGLKTMPLLHHQTDKRRKKKKSNEPRADGCFYPGSLVASHR